MGELSIDIMPLIAGALLQERHYWRETAACHIGVTLASLEHGWKDGRTKARKLKDLREDVHLLSDAMAGDLFQHCEACSLPIFPGQVQIPCSDVEMHADCGGHRYAAGDHIEIPRESVEVDEGETYPGYVVVFAAAPLFTDEQIAERLEHGLAALKAAGQR